MKDPIGTQFISLLRLPGQIKRTADSQYQAYALKKKLKVRQNQLDPTYGKKPFNMKSVSKAAEKIF